MPALAAGSPTTEAIADFACAFRSMQARSVVQAIGRQILMEPQPYATLETDWLYLASGRHLC
ncbi:hypothetical protein [Synechococcus sp. PCC 7336]|uniref:hypothetical protein n=1 Tax=Synechococcus sp. PCC 7336 TaxID=195250 RepID=UPI00034DE612|nr:hypothetical protein [Synechococcus sp. PCC 7336]